MQTYFLVVKTKTLENKVQQINSTTLKVFVKTEPVEGKANKMIIKILSDYFSVPQSCITLERGHTSKFKKIKIHC